MMAQSAGRSPDDIVFGAHIDDYTDEFFSGFDLRVEKVADNVDKKFQKVDKSLENTEKQSKDTMQGLMGAIESFGGMIDKVIPGAGEVLKTFGGDVAEIGTLFEGLPATIAGVETATVAMAAAGVAAVVLLVKILDEVAQKYAKIAAPAADAISAAEHLAYAHGISEKALSDSVEALRSYGVNIEESNRLAVDLIRAEVDLADTHKLAAKAANFHASTGEPLNKVLEGMLNAIKMVNTEGLKQYDIFLDDALVMDDYAKSLNRPVESLTEMEKQQALLNAAMADADRHAGAFEARMGTVAKQSEDLERRTQDLKVAFGLAFQPYYAQILEFKNQKLKEMIDWVERNRDVIEDWATVFGNAIVGLMKAVKGFGDALLWLFDIPRKLGRGTAELILKAFNVPDEEINERIGNVGKAFRQLASITGAIIMTIIDLIVDFAAGSFDSIVSIAKATAAIFKGELGKAADIMDELRARMDERFEVKLDFAENVAELADFWNVLDDVDSAAATAEQGFWGMEQSVDSLTDAVEDASRAFSDLMDDYQQELARAGVEEARKQIENQIKAANKLEDIEINFHKRIKDALEDSQSERREALERHNEDRIGIIRDYQRKIRNIQQDFNREAYELARKRDAVGLMELIRSNEAKLDEEKQSRDDRISDQDRLFSLELKHIERRKQEEIAAIQERRQEEIESLKRSLDRQRELEALHRQWQIEDRQEKYRQRLEDLVAHYQQEEGLTYQHLQNMLNQFGQYFSNLAQLTNQAAKAGISTSGSAGALSWEDLQRQKARNARGGVKGQAGLVSAMLPPSRSFDINKDFGRTVPQIPTTYPGSEGGGRRDINVNVSGDALDPVIQRELVRSLLEIERNRS